MLYRNVARSRFSIYCIWLFLHNVESVRNKEQYERRLSSGPREAFEYLVL